MSIARALALPVLGCAAMGLAACVVGPTYRSPESTAGGSFRQTPETAARITLAPAPGLEKWWEGFGDPELDRLVARGLRQNLDLAQAEARLVQARAGVVAAGALLLPKAQLDAQAAGAHQSLDSPLGRIESAFPGFDRDEQLYDLNASAGWEIDLFGGLRRGSQAAKADYQASAAARAGARLTVAAEVADAYVMVRTYQARLIVVREQLETQRKLVAIIEVQFSHGIVPRLRLDQVRGDLSIVQGSVPVLETGLEAQTNRLEVLVAAEPGSLRADLSQSAPIPAAPAIETSGGPAALIRNRPDLIAAERTLAASSARIGVAVSDYYPKVSLSALLGFESGASSNLLTSAAFQPQGAIGLRWRLFDFGRVDAEVASAKGREAEALAAYKLAVLRATADVETALDAVVKHEAQARALQAGEASLSDAQSAALFAYRAGQVSLIEVLDADDRLLQARDQRVLAQSEATRAAITSFKALGGGWSL